MEKKTKNTYPVVSPEVQVVCKTSHALCWPAVDPAKKLYTSNRPSPIKHRTLLYLPLPLIRSTHLHFSLSLRLEDVSSSPAQGIQPATGPESSFLLGAPIWPARLSVSGVDGPLCRTGTVRTEGGKKNQEW